MKIGFLSLPASGHLNPMTALARRLQSRGHEVIYLGVPDAEPAVRAAGLAFLPYGEDRYPPGSIPRIFEPVSRMAGMEVLDHTLRTISPGLLEVALRDLPGLLAGSGIDAMVIDSVYFFAQLVPMGLGIPFVRAWAILPIHPAAATPPAFVSWPHDTTPEALARNAEGMAAFGAQLEPLAAIARPYAEAVGLDIDWSDPTATFSRLAEIVQTPEAFDYPGVGWPAQFYFAGPFHDGEGREPVPFPWGRLDGRPIIYASLGTLVNGRDAIHRAILDATAGMHDVQLVFSVGKNADPGDLGPIPPDAIVVPVAPQIDLLKKAALCITHAGMNTTLEALGQGVPLVAIPIGYDQPGVAARIAYHRVGEFVEPEDLTPEGLAAVIRKVLGDPAYRDRARSFRAAIEAANGLEVACDLIELAFGSRLATPADSPLAGRTAGAQGAIGIRVPPPAGPVLLPPVNMRAGSL
ncbi:nucleotide disphospho-sugar-binding domain-containing protein [Tundrisphaera sp. TA3]|uniref:nucleotide disphospho-sugar-binding domain-containing protein n=1 Tax=Tundrisphaera sp. TA3 TaxID=3435775 RepID=UPI003EB6D645